MEQSSPTFGEPLLSFDQLGSASSSIFSPDGQTMLSMSYSENATLWNADRSSSEFGTPIQRFEQRLSGVNYIFNFESNTVLSTAENDLVLWGTSDGELIRTFRGHTRPIMDAELAPDGRELLTGSRDSTIILWDFATGQPLRTSRGHTEAVTGVAYIPDGTAAISTSRDGTVRWWPLTAEALNDWVQNNRYVRELTCEERATYRIEPQCETDSE